MPAHSSHQKNTSSAIDTAVNSAGPAQRYFSCSLRCSFSVAGIGFELPAFYRPPDNRF